MLQSTPTTGAARRINFQGINLAPLAGPDLGMPTMVVIVAGTAHYPSPGSASFGVPPYHTLTVDVQGAGGSGSSGINGIAGGGSFVGSVIANGGGGGIVVGGPGAPGSASGGTTNTTGGGAAGGYAGPGANDYPGGNGGRAQITWTAGAPGAPHPGDILSVAIGAGGPGISYFGTNSGPGANGSVSLSWT